MVTSNTAVLRRESPRMESWRHTSIQGIGSWYMKIRCLQHQPKPALIPRPISTGGLMQSWAWQLQLYQVRFKANSFFWFLVLLIHEAILGIRGGRKVPVEGMKMLRAEGLQERFSETRFWVYLSLETSEEYLSAWDTIVHLSALRSDLCSTRIFFLSISAVHMWPHEQRVRTQNAIPSFASVSFLYFSDDWSFLLAFT